MNNTAYPIPTRTVEDYRHGSIRAAPYVPPRRPGSFSRAELLESVKRPAAFSGLDPFMTPSGIAAATAAIVAATATYEPTFTCSATAAPPQ